MDDDPQITAARTSIQHAREVAAEGRPANAYLMLVQGLREAERNSPPSAELVSLWRHAVVELADEYPEAANLHRQSNPFRH